MTMVFVLSLVLLGAPLAYWYLLALGALAGHFRNPRRPYAGRPTRRFAVVIAAHDEASVIAETVRALRNLDYPVPLFDIHVVADHCTDRTADLAESAGAIAHRRDSGPRGGKGAALSWLFARVLAGNAYDAVVVFDADTVVSRGFLRIMDTALRRGATVVQGQHVIGNPGAGWFPALTHAKFLIDNEFHNFGRTVIGLSAKNMGDAICLRADVLRELGWGEGLTEDYQLRQKLLLAGHSIAYVAEATAVGEAPPTWKQAKVQRLRWMKGAKDVSESFRRRLLTEAFRRKSLVLLDAALESYLPTFSTLAAFAGVVGIALLSTRLIGLPSPALSAFAIYLALLVAYPFLGLCLAGAPLSAFLALAGGPIFVAWRAWAALFLRLRRPEIKWIRTPHGKTAA